MRQYTRLSIIIVGNFDEGNISNELHDFGREKLVEFANFSSYTVAMCFYND